MPPTPADEWEEALLAAAGDVEGRDVLELGCGEGDLSLKLLARGARLTGLDLSPGMAAVAAARAERFVPGAAARFLAAPAERTGLGDASFDVAIGKFVLHHLDLAPAAAELARSPRPAGTGLFMETSGVNPALAWSRRHLVGRFGVFRDPISDQQPLTRQDLRRMTESFGRVRARFPVFHLVQMLERQVLRYHLPTAGPLCRPVGPRARGVRPAPAALRLLRARRAARSATGLTRTTQRWVGTCLPLERLKMQESARPTTIFASSHSDQFAQYR